MKITCEYCGKSYSPRMDSVCCGNKECRKQYQKQYRKSDKYKQYWKQYQKQYRKSDKYKQYLKSDKYKQYLKQYRKLQSDLMKKFRKEQQVKK